MSTLVGQESDRDENQRVIEQRISEQDQTGKPEIADNIESISNS